MPQDTQSSNRVQVIVNFLTDECERAGADAADEQGIVRQIVTTRLAERPNIHFEAWLLVCCELADRAARREGYENQVHRAMELAKQKVRPADKVSV